MDIRKVNFKEFMTVIDKCQGPVRLLTEEGDIINMKSKLSQIIGLLQLIEGGEIRIADIHAESLEDKSRITRYLLYREV